jgi:hypothetical protein
MYCTITVIRRLIISKHQVPSQGIPRAICFGQNATERAPTTTKPFCFSLSVSFQCSIIVHPSFWWTMVPLRAAFPRRQRQRIRHTGRWNLFSVNLNPNKWKAPVCTVQRDVNFYPGSWPCNVTTFSVNENRHLWCNSSNNQWYAGERGPSVEGTVDWLRRRWWGRGGYWFNTQTVYDPLHNALSSTSAHCHNDFVLSVRDVPLALVSARYWYFPHADSRLLKCTMLSYRQWQYLVRSALYV